MDKSKADFEHLALPISTGIVPLEEKVENVLSLPEQLNSDVMMPTSPEKIPKIVDPIVERFKHNLSKKVSSKKKAYGPKGRKRKLSKNSEIFAEEFEVEKIVGHSKIGDKVSSYRVKWRGWDEQYSTWEPLDHLRSSLALVADYYQNKLYPGKGEIVFKSVVETLRAELSVLNDKVIDDFCYRYLTENGHSIVIDERVVEENLAVLSRIPPFARDNKMVEEVRKQLQLVEFRRRREEQLELLKNWEIEINAISSAAAPVKICNAVDLEGVPKNFHFTDKNIPDWDVVVPDDNPLACDCSEGCLNKSCCWNSQWNEPPYTKDGALRYAKGVPIFECNKNCKCGPNCGTRILQKGRTVPVSIFKTANGCGWGVRTLEPIKKGHFVVEYVGEIIKNEVAELRGRTYDKIGCTYLFDLDFESEDDCPYTIDAAIYGNVSHFINHSCEPNLTVFAVWVDCLDLKLPRLGLYASRNIKAFEQLSFDYMMERPSSKIPKKDEKQTLCRCGAKHCRKLVF